MSNNLADSAFIRIGPSQVIAKVEDLFTVQITLNGSPDAMWIECYRHPTDYTDNESHPSRTVVKGDKIVFFSIESQLENNIMALDKYIQHANGCYRKKLVQLLSLNKSEDLQKKNKQDELNRVNKNISGF